MERRRSVDVRCGGARDLRGGVARGASRAGAASSARRIAALALAALGIGAACAGAAQRHFAAARSRYDACVAASGERACGPERERLLAAERAYQDAARRGWGCDPAQEECPTAR